MEAQSEAAERGEPPFNEDRETALHVKPKGSSSEQGGPSVGEKTVNWSEVNDSTRIGEVEIKVIGARNEAELRAYPDNP
jgi:hypothetical protein